MQVSCSMRTQFASNPSEPLQTTWMPSISITKWVFVLCIIHSNEMHSVSIFRCWKTPVQTRKVQYCLHQFNALLVSMLKFREAFSCFVWLQNSVLGHNRNNQERMDKEPSLRYRGFSIVLDIPVHCNEQSFGIFEGMQKKYKLICIAKLLLRIHFKRDGVADE